MPLAMSAFVASVLSLNHLDTVKLSAVESLSARLVAALRALRHS